MSRVFSLDCFKAVTVYNLDLADPNRGKADDELKPLRPIDQQVLVVLAEHAQHRDETRRPEWEEVWPGTFRIAAQAGCSASEVSKAMGRLRDAGLIQPWPKGTSHRFLAATRIEALADRHDSTTSAEAGRLRAAATELKGAHRASVVLAEKILEAWEAQRQPTKAELKTIRQTLDLAAMEELLEALHLEPAIAESTAAETIERSTLDDLRTASSVPPGTDMSVPGGTDETSMSVPGGACLFQEAHCLFPQENKPLKEPLQEPPPPESSVHQEGAGDESAGEDVVDVDASEGTTKVDPRLTAQRWLKAAHAGMSTAPTPTDRDVDVTQRALAAGFSVRQLEALMAKSWDGAGSRSAVARSRIEGAIAAGPGSVPKAEPTRPQPAEYVSSEADSRIADEDQQRGRAGIARVRAERAEALGRVAGPGVEVVADAAEVAA